jgi:hypothetical protein
MGRQSRAHDPLGSMQMSMTPTKSVRPPKPSKAGLTGRAPQIDTAMALATPTTKSARNAKMRIFKAGPYPASNAIVLTLVASMYEIF